MWYFKLYEPKKGILVEIPLFRVFQTSTSSKSAKKNRKNFETFSLAKYDPGLVEKPYGNSQKRPSQDTPRFLSQNVEYVPFIDRAPHY